MAPDPDTNPARDPDLAHKLRSYAKGAVDVNLRQMLLRIAAAYDAESARLQVLETTRSAALSVLESAVQHDAPGDMERADDDQVADVEREQKAPVVVGVDQRRQ
jgi:hypothetical protein